MFLQFSYNNNTFSFICLTRLKKTLFSSQALEKETQSAIDARAEAEARLSASAGEKAELQRRAEELSSQEWAEGMRREVEELKVANKELEEEARKKAEEVGELQAVNMDLETAKEELATR